MRKIGILVDVVGRFGRGVLEGATNYSFVAGQIELVTPTLYGFSKHPEWEKWPITGMVLQAHTHQLVDAAIRLKERNIPTVNVSGWESRTKLPTVTVDNFAVGKMAAEHLLEKGFRHLTYIGEATLFGEERGVGFAARAKEAGVTSQELIITYGVNLRESQERKDLVQWLRGLQQPHGIFVVTDGYAQIVIQACAEAGIVVPEGMAVLGCDNDELHCRRTNPPLSSVILPAEQIGYEAMARLMRLVEGGEPEPTAFLLPIGIAQRRSTDVMAIDDAEIVEVLKYIREHAHEGIKVSDIVAAVPMSRRAMERRFLETVGHSPLDEIRRVRCSIAMELLAETDLQMPEIARRCGIATETYFGLFFRKRVGMTPTEYRQRHRRRGISS